MHQNEIILLAGPTASGKSKLAIKLANEIRGEIINADSMQIYKEISILNSKPKISELKSSKHHLYGFTSVKKNFSVGLWVKFANKKINEILKQGLTPIVVGGTGLYFKVLIDGIAEVPNIPKLFRKKIVKLHKKLGQKEFYNKLIDIDPLAKNFITESDSQRSIRAYEVKSYTQISLFIWIKKTRPVFVKKNFIKFFINTPKIILHQKINERVEKMFKEGAINEVKKFLKLKVNKNLSSNRIIGVSEIQSYLDKKVSLEQAKEIIKLKTRQYSKRQFTWARGHMKSWDSIYSSNFKDLFKKAINRLV